MCDSSSSLVFFFDISQKKNRKIYLFSHGAECVSVCACVCVSLRIYTDFHVPTQLSCHYTSSLTHSHKSALTFSRSSLKKKERIGSLDGLFSSTFFLPIQISLHVISPLPSLFPNSDTHYAIWFTAKIPQRNRTSLSLTYFIALVISSSCTVQLSPSSATFLAVCFTR